MVVEQTVKMAVCGTWPGGGSIAEDKCGGMVVDPVEPIVLACIDLVETVPGQWAADCAPLKIPGTVRSSILHEGVIAWPIWAWPIWAGTIWAWPICVGEGKERDGLGGEARRKDAD